MNRYLIQLSKSQPHPKYPAPLHHGFEVTAESVTDAITSTSKRINEVGTADQIIHNVLLDREIEKVYKLLDGNVYELVFERT